MDRKSIDDKAVRAAGDIKRFEVELIETLQLVDRLKVFADFGFPSLFAYFMQRLKLSEDRSCTFIQIARKALQIPALKKAITENKLTVSNAKKLTKVLNLQNQADWLEKGETLSTRNLEKEIVKVCPAEKINERVKPVSASLFELRCSLSPHAVELLERAMDLLKNQNRGEVIEKVLEAFVDRTDPMKIAERAEKRKAPAQAPVALPAIKTGKRTAVPRPLGNAALRKAGGQCTHVGPLGVRCPERRYVEKHHSLPVSRGGLHSADNIVVLCSGHHATLHRAAASI